MILNNCTRWARLLALSLTIAMSLSVANVFAQSPTFVTTDHSFLGNQVVGDFNGDGSLDLAGLGYLVQAAQVRLNNGAGTFGAVVDYPVPWGQDIATGDFNRDGRLDLVLTHNDPQISLSLLTGNGDGTFNAPVNFPNTSGFDSPAIVATDINNDAKLDVVIAHGFACFTAPCIVGRTISVILGNGDGTFQPSREIDVGIGMSEIAVGDFNRDGGKDLAIGGDSSRVYLLFGVGDGTFIQQTLTLADINLGMDATDIDVADFNGDTIQDLVVAIALNGSRTAILIGNGDGAFQPPLIITDPNVNIPHQQAVADYNGDGFQDLALSQADGNQGLMLIRNGNGNGTFQPPVVYLVPPPLSSAGGAAIVSADLNNDNKTDIVLGQSGAFPGLKVLINSTGVTPPPTPSAPTLVSPPNGATGVAQPVTLDWNNVTNATSYEVQVDNSSTISAPFTANPTVTVSQATLSGLPAQKLWWRVRARNSAGVFGPFSSTRRFTPQAAPAAATLSAIALNPSTVVGGNASQGTATLTSAAPAGGALVTLTSSNTAVATVPASVTVASGSTSATFTVTTASVTASSAATISGSHGGATRSATLTVTPPAQTVTLTVTATGRSGERVTSSPAGINVAVGSSGSASFVSGTAITLSVSNGRDAIWSGACSSGGNKSKTCTFALSGNATVTANVQ